MLLAAFTILFGTRHLDATERHEGLVAAIRLRVAGEASRFHRGRAVRHFLALRRFSATSSGVSARRTS